uniref:BPTI/Kunitz inhibitor domain-containing protein n=1 Tax=Panagrolaimus sp. JU765 TaxID=591449 RepID=A0AC34PUV7_9BILA
MPKDSGYQCGMSVPHSAYYFDVAVGQCIEFHFFGCGGNQNRFGTKEECIKGCGVLARCVKGLPLMDFAGNLKHCDGDRVPCPGGYECVGKGMDSVCCWKADRICGMSVDAGKHCGTVSETRFFYDSGANLCRPFAYLGCAGNENNFKTKGECLKFCAPEISCLKGDPWPDRYAV